MRSLFQWLSYVLFRSRHDADLREEIEAHRVLRQAALERDGLAPAQAVGASRRALGNVALAMDEAHDVWTIRLIDTLRLDVRLAVRGLRRSPGFALVAIGTLALGIAANTAIFSFVNAAFFVPYHVEAPERLVRLWGQDLPRHILQLGFSVPKYELIRDQQTSFTALGAATQLPKTLLLNGTEPIQVNGSLTTSAFLDAFGAAPIAGRFFRADEERGAGVAVVGEKLWRARFAANPAIIGQPLIVDGASYTVIGVAPRLPAFWDADIWTTNPLQFPGIPEDTIRRGFSYLQPVGRLKPGVSEEQARRELGVLATRYASAYPANADAAWTLTAVGLRDDIVGASRSSLLTLLAAVGLLLMVACANVANLVLVRFAGRRQEQGVRAALGASRARIIRPFLIESVMVSAAAAALGAAIAYWALPGLLVLARNTLPFADDIRISLPVLATTALVALAAGVTIGLLPAVQGSRADVMSVLRDGGRTVTAAAGGDRARRAIVTAQVAMSLVLVIGAGLLVTSFDRLRRQEAGFDPTNVFVATVSLPPARYPDSVAQSRFWLHLREALSNAPGVAQAALSSQPPLSGGFTRAPYALNEGAVPPLNERPLGLTMSVTPGYFATLKIPILAGRDFTERDTADEPLVAIMSKATARRLGGDRDLLGRRIIMGSQGGGQVMEVIGVVDDVRTQSLAATSEVEFYRPVMQRPRQLMAMLVRTAADPAAFESTARHELHGVDATLPLTGITTHRRLIEQSLAQQRLLFLLLGVFAVLAVVLSAVGIYGVVASFVGQRIPEIGVRVALGASRPQVIAIVLGQSLLPVGAGLFIGLTAAVALAPLVRGLLFEISPFDPVMMGSGVALVALAAAAACAIPAGRAARIDPVTALRSN